MDDDFATSRLVLERATRDPFARVEAHYMLWEVCQACGDLDDAMAHLWTAIRLDPLRTRPPAPGIRPVRSVLAINTPGDFQANLPLPMLLDGGTLLRTFWLTSGPVTRDDWPPFDCVFIAIAEDERHRAALAAADALAERLGRPVINNGGIIALLSRTNVPQRLAGIDGAVVPAHRAVRRARLAETPRPFIVRPDGSHAGRGLALIEQPSDLASYLARDPAADRFTVAPFIDYRSEDGLYRKMRIVFVGGRPAPVHLAIHDDWAVWYYNAAMWSSPAKQAEEARFLADMPGFVGGRAMRALDEIAERVGLDYFGLDCAVLRDGRLLVFEVETGMIVHDRDAAPEKRAAAQRIFRAVERMIDERIDQRRTGAARAASPVPVRAL